MLSTANPPPDPNSDELKSNFISSSDEKANNYLEVDLLKSGLDDISQTLPKFSIRDYVFKTRTKDIKAHWPFSQKKLQLCLKHGVKDVLPPFETLEPIRNPSVINLSRQSDLLLPVSSKNVSQKKLALDTENIKSNSPKKDKECYPSDVNPVPFRIKSPFPKPETAVRAANKVRSNISTQNPAKKCRLIVKVGNNNISEDLSDAMASKVCPVCKTFTSSSNTTLNAHIDQCLSGESTSVKWTANPKVIKPRIKPRKTRLMVDIYETAIPCTLEDLDRRNGTNWASSFQAQEINFNNRNENHFVSNGEDKKEEEGSVYIDSNGTKVRILSKLSDMRNNSNAEEDNCGPRKTVKWDKESKIVPSMKTKLLKSQLYEQRRCSPRLDSCSKVNNALEIKSPHDETKKDNFSQPLKSCDRQTESNYYDCRTKNPWASSKRSGHKNVKNPEHKSDHHPNKIIKNSKISTRPLSDTESDHTSYESENNTSISSGDEYVPKQQQQKQKQKQKRKQQQQQQQPCLTNRACFYFSDSPDDQDNGKDDHITLSNSNVKWLKGNGSTVNVNSPFISSRGKKLSTFSKKNSLSIRRESFSESKNCLGSRENLSGFKKPAIRMRNNYPEENEGETKETRVEKHSRVSKIRNKIWGFSNDTASSSESDSHGYEQNNLDSFAGHVMPASTSDSMKAIGISDDFVHVEPLVAFGDDFVAEVNGKEGEGNYFLDVDPIPIPGPPGSFLPSPGRMGSEELQGNSSLTSCRIHSSEDERELIIDRMDSSDSPISGTSFVSNSIAARPNSQFPFRAFGQDGNSKTDDLRAKSAFPESRSPSTPNPVLRLMGKDLMVVNKEENPTTQSRPAGFISMANGFPNQPSRADDATNFSRGSFVFDDAKTRMPFDLPSNFAPHHQSRAFGSSSLDYCHGYGAGAAFRPDPSNRGGQCKETIVIEDSPGNGPSLGFKGVNPFFEYQTRCYPHVPISNVMNNGNSVMWGRDLAALQRRDLLNAPAQSTGHHERSAFYFSNGFSLPSNFS